MAPVLENLMGVILLSMQLFVVVLPVVFCYSFCWASSCIVEEREKGASVLSLERIICLLDGPCS
jgi:hypothetical protein